MPSSEKVGDYWHFEVVGENGRTFHLLFTESQVKVAQSRAEEHPQLVPAHPKPDRLTWWQRWFAWLRDEK